MRAEMFECIILLLVQYIHEKNEVNINEPKTSINKLIYNYSKVTIQPERKHTLWGELERGTRVSH